MRSGPDGREHGPIAALAARIASTMPTRSWPATATAVSVHQGIPKNSCVSR